MFEILDRQTSLTGNQIKILAAAIIGDALEFFDYFLIGFVLAFLIGPWKLTFGQSAIVLMSSGIGAILGAYVWGWLADQIGRRKVFICTVLNFSIATGLLYFTPDNGWIYLSVMRFFVGVGVGGLYCVDLPLVQEFMPSSKRGWVGGLVTCVIPLGTGLGAVIGANIGSGDWRLLFAIACCRPSWCCWFAFGYRNRRAGSAARAATRKRVSRWPGRCSWNRPRCRCRPPPTPVQSSKAAGSICSNIRAA
jgi:putative MFS transporter